MANSPAESSTSIVIEYEVPRGKEQLFQQWQSEFRSVIGQFKGYVRTDLCPPIDGTQNKWYVVVHFDDPISLTNWLDSDSRHDLVRAGRRKFGPYRYKGIGTGLEGWFSNQKNADEAPSNPPAWKQILAVLFGLYPTVMLETLLFSHFHLMESWSIAYKMFVNNLVSCCLLTWVVMPAITRLLSFWLKPQQTTFKLNLVGTFLVAIGYGLMISGFHFLT
jgi:antibiotic biosynthesis monooxygenase (ABM) superfamily enzyme